MQISLRKHGEIFKCTKSSSKSARGSLTFNYAINSFNSRIGSTSPHVYRLMCVYSLVILCVCMLTWELLRPLFVSAPLGDTLS